MRMLARPGQRGAALREPARSRQLHHARIEHRPEIPPLNLRAQRLLRADEPRVEHDAGHGGAALGQELAEHDVVVVPRSKEQPQRLLGGADQTQHRRTRH